MPLYDYRCGECGREVEVMHGIHESGPEHCDHCGGAMRKALSTPAIHFKGSGWAKKDAAASAKKPTSTAGGPAGSTTSSTSADSSKAATDDKSAGASDASSSATKATPAAKGTGD